MFMSDGAFMEIQAQNAYLRQQNEDLSKQIAHLTEQIIELKRDGFARPTTQMVNTYTPPKLDDRILAAIRTVAAEGTPLERELAQFAEAQLLMDEEVEDIADRIMAGASLGDD